MSYFFNKAKLARMLTEAREERGLSIRGAAKLSEISISTISRAERMHTTTYQTELGNLLSLCKFYQIDPLQSVEGVSHTSSDEVFHGNTPVKHLEGGAV